ncbi:MAG: efflux RND transporter periplasmic adaptor subunit [Candidatus Staskawiczbacteria bacterium]|nr:efflux RND transporter periplasmic adaptor subunit [Candidatus Staskawiczbacteria bacterium]
MENKTIQNLEKAEAKIIKGTKKEIIAVISIFVIILGGIAGLATWNIISSRIYVENSLISATVINLSPKVGGTLQEVFANVGDLVQINAPIARIGNELIKANSNGRILSIDTNIGDSFGPNQAVATMIDPSDLRVVGQVQEDKGLKDIKIGQTAIFTVDAFGSKEYSGIVDQINPTSNTGSILFNISDTRQENDFDVKIRFNVNSYPELKNGMSAKLWIYK